MYATSGKDTSPSGSGSTRLGKCMGTGNIFTCQFLLLCGSLISQAVPAGVCDLKGNTAMIIS